MSESTVLRGLSLGLVIPIASSGSATACPRETWRRKVFSSGSPHGVEPCRTASSLPKTSPIPKTLIGTSHRSFTRSTSCRLHTTRSVLTSSAKAAAAAPVDEKDASLRSQSLRPSLVVPLTDSLTVVDRDSALDFSRMSDTEAGRLWHFAHSNGDESTSVSAPQNPVGATAQKEEASKRHGNSPSTLDSWRRLQSLEVQTEPPVEKRNPIARALAMLSKKIEDSIPPRFRGLILLNILTFLYGSNITVVKEAESALDPFSFCAFRFAIAAVAFAPFLSSAMRNPPVRRAGLELGVWSSIAYVTQAVGLITTDAGRASFIGTFTVIEVPILAGLFGARIPPITWFAAFAAICGVGLLESSAADSSFFGDFWTIVSALVFGMHILRSEHHAKHVTTTEALPLISLQLAVTAVLSALWVATVSSSGHAPGSGWEMLIAGDWSEVTEWPWLEMVYTGVLSTAFCLWVEVVALKDVSAPEAAMVYTLEPLWGAAFAFILLGERWGPLGWFGAALILGGSLVMQLFGRVEEGGEHGHTTAAGPGAVVAPVMPSGRFSAAVSALGVAAALALLIAASTNTMAAGEDLASSSSSTSAGGVLELVRKVGLWTEVERGWQLAVEGFETDDLAVMPAVMAIGGEELASLSSLIKVYALVRQEEEDEACEELQSSAGDWMA